MSDVVCRNAPFSAIVVDLGGSGEGCAIRSQSLVGFHFPGGHTDIMQDGKKIGKGLLIFLSTRDLFIINKSKLFSLVLSTHTVIYLPQSY